MNYCILAAFIFFQTSNGESIVPDGFYNATEDVIKRSNHTDYLIEEYFAVLLVLVNLPENETESLEKYLKRRTYAELKRMIDAKTVEAGFDEDLDFGFGNFTDLAHFLESAESQKFVDIIDAYHNASVYSLIRGVWNSQLHTILPPIDQLAILEYFEEKQTQQSANRSLFQRLWEAIQRIFVQRIDSSSCAADRPECMRRLVDIMEKGERTEIERAADDDDVQTVEGKIGEELNRLPADLREEFAEWRADNYPPVALLNIIYDANNEEKEALDRLRTHGLVSSLKDYYRAMIEMKQPEEQEEIKQFFERMNDTFARCYNPARHKYATGYF